MRILTVLGFFCDDCHHVAMAERLFSEVLRRWIAADLNAFWATGADGGLPGTLPAPKPLAPMSGKVE